MKKLIITAMCLACSPVFADATDENQEQGPIEEMQIVLTTMEQIDVTVEKKPLESSEDLDREIESILLDAEALDAEEVEE